MFEESILQKILGRQEVRAIPLALRTPFLHAVYMVLKENGKLLEG